MSILPDIEEVRTVVKTIRVPNEVKKVLSTQTAILLASLAVIMGAGIFIIGHKKGKGLLFLGIVYLVSALLITLFIILGQINFIEFLGLNSLDIFANLLDATITRCADNLAYGVLISVILGAAFIIAFVLINRKKAMAEASKIEPYSTQQKNASV